ncbi:unnamed protein product [Anisakis simplex]|nr:unnamed protein product [Anisakis simplex]
MPEWLKIDPNEIRDRLSDGYDRVKREWSERDRVWLNTLQDKLKKFEGMWQRGFVPTEGPHLLLSYGKFFDLLADLLTDQFDLLTVFDLIELKLS